MRRIMHVMALAAIVFVAAGCKDQPARDHIDRMKTALDTYFQQENAWEMKVRNAVCQLEYDVYNVKDSGNDTRVAGNSGSYRLCPDGPGDPNAGLPPKPPVLE